MLRRLLAGSVAVAALLLAAPALAQPAAEPAPAEASVTSYPPAFFAEYRPTTAMDMVNRLPGFTFQGGTDARGFAGTAGNVLIDGERPPSRGDSLEAVLARIPANAVARIDLVRGGAGGLDMQGQTVIANVIRRAAGAATSGAVSGSVTVNEFGELSTSGELQLQRQFGTARIEGSLAADADDGTIRARGERRAPDGTLLRRFKNVGYAHDMSYAATGVYEGDLGAGRLRVNTRIRHYWDENGVDNILFVPGGVEFSGAHEHGTSGELGLRYNRKLRGEAALELVAFQQLSDDTSVSVFNPPDFTSTTAYRARAGESILDAKLKLPAWRTWAFETGLEGVFNFQDSSTDFIFNGEILDIPGSSTRVEELRTEGFVTATWTPQPKLTLETGLRYERSTITAEGNAGPGKKSLSFPKPRAILTWTPNPHHQVLLRVERTVEQLSFFSFAASAQFSTGVFGVGNPDIEPSKTWTYEARYEYRFGQRGSVLINATREQLEDLLANVVVAVIPPGETEPVFFDIARNIIDTNRDTVTVNADLPLDGLGMTGGMLTIRSAWRRALIDDPVTGERRDITNTQHYDWNVKLSQNITHLRLTWDITAATGQRYLSFSPRQTGFFESNYRLGVDVTWRPTDKLSLSVGGNMLNGGWFHNSYTLYDAPRNIGHPVYTQVSNGYNKSQIYVSARRAF